jgi:parvulin-like peptidyl-prolyl isomerase
MFFKKKGGELGYFGRGKMVHEFEEAAFSTPPGQMSNIIKTVHGYHIILVEDRKASIK